MHAKKNQLNNYRFEEKSIQLASGSALTDLRIVQQPTTPVSFDHWISPLLLLD